MMVASAPWTATIALLVDQVFKPSSSHASSNSLLPTIPYQNWWPNSWTVTSSTRRILSNGQEFNSQADPAVMNVGYSMPPAPPAPGAGSTTVSVLKGYLPYRSPYVLQPRLRRVDVALRLRPVIGLQQHRDVDIRQLHLVERPPEQLRRALVLGRRDILRGRKRRLDDDVVRIGCPREVVNVGLLVRVGGRAVAVRAHAFSLACGADDEGGRDGDVDGVRAEVGVELRVRVELVAVPPARLAPAHARRLVDAQLREPLAGEVEVVLVPRACEHLRQLRREGQSPASRTRPAAPAPAA